MNAEWSKKEDALLHIFYPCPLRESEIDLLFPNRNQSSLRNRARILKIRKLIKSDLDRFNSFYFIAIPNFCWVWNGNSDKDGYGIFSINSRGIRAHRWSYEHFIGPIPEGLVIDHLCRNRSCVNPEHLEIVTNKENILRGEGAAAKNSRKFHCKNGHEFVDDNLKYDSLGKRVCVTCRRLSYAWKGGVSNPLKTHCKYGHEFTPENTYLYHGIRQCKICRKSRFIKWKIDQEKL